MLRFSSPVTLKLARGELLAWQQGAVRLRVVSGLAWVTQRHVLDDHFLQPGQTLWLRRGAAALIGAEQDSLLRFETGRGGLAAWAAAAFRAAFAGRVATANQLSNYRAYQSAAKK